VIVEVLEIPLTVKVPALAVIDPRCAVVTYNVGDVIVDVLAIPVTVKVPALAVIDPK